MKTNREKILEQPAYWVEAINGILYNAILDYMEESNLNRTQLAEVLGISKGRVSQILNDGNINFSIQKMVEILLKIDKIPILNLEDKTKYIAKIKQPKNSHSVFLNEESPKDLTGLKDL